MKYFSILSAALLILTSSLIAQDTPDKKPNPFKTNYIDASLTAAIPMDAFANTSSSLPFGITFNYLHQASTRSPILFGGGLTYLSAGSKTIKETLSADIKVGNTIIDQLNIPLEFRIGNSIFHGHAMMRFQGYNQTIKPYFDLLAGFNYFWTSTTLYDRSTQNYFQSQNNNQVVFSKNQLNSLSWTAGAGAGVMARLSSNIYLNIGANYMFGGPIKYYDRDQIRNWDIELSSSAANSAIIDGTIDEDDVLVNAIPKRSISNMLMANVGVTFVIGSSNTK